MRFEFTQDGEFVDPYYIGFDDDYEDVEICKLWYVQSKESWYVQFDGDFGHNEISLIEISEKIEELNEQTRRDRIFYWF